MILSANAQGSWRGCVLLNSLLSGMRTKARGAKAKTAGARKIEAKKTRAEREDESVSQAGGPGAVNLVKLCVGADSLEDLADWVTIRTAENQKRGLGRVHDHVTRMFPRRREDLLDGGSLSWVIKGVVRARQSIVDLQSVSGADGIERCAILLDPQLIETESQPRRAFQGWRYLEQSAAPGDLKESAEGTPPELKAALAELGLL